LLLLENGALLGTEVSNQGRPWRSTLHKQSNNNSKMKPSTSTSGRFGSKQLQLVDHDGLSPISFLTSLPEMRASLLQCFNAREGGEVYSFGSETADFQLG